jgi:hypothetical protein
VSVSEATVVVNPQVELFPIGQDRTVSAITVRAPVKGLGQRVTTIDRSEPETFAALLMHMIGRDAPVNSSAAEYDRLCEIGFLVASVRASQPVWYSCDVLDSPTDLVPVRARRDLIATGLAGDLVVNPALQHFGREGPPGSMRGRLKLRNQFHPDRSWLWIQEEDLRAPRLYSYSSERAIDLSCLVAAEAAAPTLDEATRHRLLAADVLMPASAVSRRREDRDARLARARRELQADRHTVLRHVIPPLEIAALRQYYRDAIAQGFFEASDAEWPNRSFSSRDGIAQFFHAQLTGLVSEIVGAQLKPSFQFFASYREGAELPPHRDREQCELAMSILLDFSPEPVDASPWPLFVQPPHRDTPAPIAQGIGDAVLYYGREVRHHRETLKNSDYSSSWFFFYVHENFQGSLD